MNDSVIVVVRADACYSPSTAAAGQGADLKGEAENEAIPRLSKLNLRQRYKYLHYSLSRQLRGYIKKVDDLSLQPNSNLLPEGAGLPARPTDRRLRKHPGNKRNRKEDLRE